MKKVVNPGIPVGAKDYFVKIDVFEGPLDLLLWLIQNNNMDIYDIEISKITSQYLAFINTHEFDIDSPAEFLAMASLLIRIKSSLMLPKETEEHQLALDEKRALTEKLLEWKKIKASREILLSKFRERKNLFRRDEPAAIELEKKSALSVFELADIFGRIIKKGFHKFEEITGPEIYIEDVIKELLERIRSGEELKFSQLAFQNPTKLYVAVLVLAVLELTNKKLVTIKQARPFTDIYIKPVLSAVSGKNITEQPSGGESFYGNG